MRLAGIISGFFSFLFGSVVAGPKLTGGPLKSELSEFISSGNCILVFDMSCPVLQKVNINFEWRAQMLPVRRSF